MTQIMQDTTVKIDTRAQALLNAMAKHEFRNASAHFDTNMTSLMPADKIEELWATLQEKAGVFVEQVSGRIVNGDNLVVALLCKFERHDLEIYVTFDATSNVSGLHVGPAPEREVAMHPTPIQ